MRFANHFFSILLFLLSVSASAQLLKKSINKYDDTGKRKGLWITYWDEEKKVPMSKVWFKDDKENRGKEYHISGKMRLKLKWYGKRIKMKYYDTERKIEQKGWATIDFNKEDIHFYWHGKWKYYDDRRKLIKVCLYQNGEMAEELFTKKGAINNINIQ